MNFQTIKHKVMINLRNTAAARKLLSEGFLIEKKEYRFCGRLQGYGFNVYAGKGSKYFNLDCDDYTIFNNKKYKLLVRVEPDAITRTRYEPTRPQHIVHRCFTPEEYDLFIPTSRVPTTTRDLYKTIMRTLNPITKQVLQNVIQP